MGENKIDGESYMPWRENHPDGGFTIRLDNIRWDDYHGQTMQFLREAYHAGNLFLFRKLDTARLIEAAFRLPTWHWMRCLLMYQDLREAIGDYAINHLIELQRKYEAAHPET
jgi:hypothetical protein